MLLLMLLAVQKTEKKEVKCDRLYQKVGQLQIEVDWLKKDSMNNSTKDKQKYTLTHKRNCP